MTVNVGQVVSISNLQIQYKVIKYTMYIKIVTHALIFFLRFEKSIDNSYGIGNSRKFFKFKKAITDKDKKTVIKVEQKINCAYLCNILNYF